MKDLPLHRLAARHGVLTSYLDMTRQERTVAPEGLRGVLEALGVPAQSKEDVESSLRRSDFVQWTTPLEPVLVAWNGRLPAILCPLPESSETRPASLELVLEDGRALDWSRPWRRARRTRAAQAGGRRYGTRRVQVRARVPLGYHRLVLELGNARHESLVISAPRHAFEPNSSSKSKRRDWGLFAPTYALRSARNWGAGDWSDLEELGRFVAAQGGNILSTLPMLPAFLDQPLEPSPYSPVSRLFWNELYLDVERIPELAECPAARRLIAQPEFRRNLDRLRRSECVDYRGAMNAKRRLIELLSRAFFSRGAPARRREFRHFLETHPRAEAYARFRAAGERRGSTWSRWPSRMREGRLRPGDYAEVHRRYHLYAQWQCVRQLSDLSRRLRRRGVDLSLDLPLGVHPEGFDVWRDQELFALGARGGCPPDPVFTRGQNWGFAPMHPAVMRRRGHDYMIESVRHHLEPARRLRLDHVMGLRRLYWVPAGLPATHGAYVNYPFEELCAILCLESVRHHAVIAGENLGTVPEEVNAAMKRHWFRELYVAQYELQPTSRPLPREPSRRSAASLNTHDMPPFKAYWEGLDIADRAALGLLSASARTREKLQRQILRKALIQELWRRRLLSPSQSDPQAVLETLLARLLAGPAESVLINLEDLWLETAPQNVPGTSAERVNWRRKTRWPMERIVTSTQLAELLGRLARFRNPNSRHA